MTDAVIVSAVRTAVGKAPKGTLRATRPDEMAATVIAEALSRAAGIEPAEVEDVMLGCAMPEGEQGMNVARIASLRAGVPIEASAVTINRFCSSGLQAIAFAAERIMVGAAETIVAGGTESMSLIPMGGHKIAPNPRLIKDYPDVYLSTGLVAENHAREAQVSREEQDAFALRSHQRAVDAIEAGRFRDEIVPLEVIVRNFAAGSMSQRLGIEEGTRLPRPIVEYCYKDDKLGDPLVTEEHIAAFGWAGQQDMEDILSLSLRVNDFMSGVMMAVGIRLVDFKLEVGRIYEGDFQRLIVADEISPDSCRLWDIETGQKLDKDVFRRDLGSLTDAYTEVARRLGVMPKTSTPMMKPTLIN